MAQSIFEQHDVLDQLFVELKSSYQLGKMPSLEQLQQIAPTLSFDEYQILIERFSVYIHDQEMQEFKAQVKKLKQEMPLLPDHIPLSTDILALEQEFMKSMGKFLINREQEIGKAATEKMQDLLAKNAEMQRELEESKAQQYELQQALSAQQAMNQKLKEASLTQRRIMAQLALSEEALGLLRAALTAKDPKSLRHLIGERSANSSAYQEFALLVGLMPAITRDNILKLVNAAMALAQENAADNHSDLFDFEADEEIPVPSTPSPSTTVLNTPASSGYPTVIHPAAASVAAAAAASAAAPAPAAADTAEARTANPLSASDNRSTEEQHLQSRLLMGSELNAESFMQLHAALAEAQENVGADVEDGDTLDLDALMRTKPTVSSALSALQQQSEAQAAALSAASAAAASAAAAPAPQSYPQLVTTDTTRISASPQNVAAPAPAESPAISIARTLSTVDHGTTNIIKQGYTTSDAAAAPVAAAALRSAPLATTPTTAITGANTSAASTTTAFDAGVALKAEQIFNGLEAICEQLFADKDGTDITSLDLENAVGVAIDEELMDAKDAALCRRLVLKMLMLGREKMSPADLMASDEDVVASLPSEEQKQFARAVLAWGSTKVYLKKGAVDEATTHSSTATNVVVTVPPAAANVPLSATAVPSAPSANTAITGTAAGAAGAASSSLSHMGSMGLESNASLTLNEDGLNAHSAATVLGPDGKERSLTIDLKSLDEQRRAEEEAKASAQQDQGEGSSLSNAAPLNTLMAQGEDDEVMVINQSTRALPRDESTLVREMSHDQGGDSIAAFAAASAKIESLIKHPRATAATIAAGAPAASAAGAAAALQSALEALGGPVPAATEAATSSDHTDPLSAAFAAAAARMQAASATAEATTISDDGASSEGGAGVFTGGADTAVLGAETAHLNTAALDNALAAAASTKVPAATIGAEADAGKLSLDPEDSEAKAEIAAVAKDVLKVAQELEHGGALGSNAAEEKTAESIFAAGTTHPLSGTTVLGLKDKDRLLGTETFATQSADAHTQSTSATDTAATSKLSALDDVISGPNTEDDVDDFITGNISDPLSTVLGKGAISVTSHQAQPEQAKTEVPASTEHTVFVASQEEDHPATLSPEEAQAPEATPAPEMIPSPEAEVSTSEEAPKAESSTNDKQQDDAARSLPTAASEQGVGESDAQSVAAEVKPESESLSEANAPEGDPATALKGDALKGGSGPEGTYEGATADALEGEVTPKAPEGETAPAHEGVTLKGGSDPEGTHMGATADALEGEAALEAKALEGEALNGAHEGDATPEGDHAAALEVVSLEGGEATNATPEGAPAVALEGEAVSAHERVTLDGGEASNATPEGAPSVALEGDATLDGATNGANEGVVAPEASSQVPSEVEQAQAMLAEGKHEARLSLDESERSQFVEVTEELARRFNEHIDYLNKLLVGMSSNKGDSAASSLASDDEDDNTVWVADLDGNYQSLIDELIAKRGLSSKIAAALQEKMAEDINRAQSTSISAEDFSHYPSLEAIAAAQAAAISTATTSSSEAEAYPESGESAEAETSGAGAVSAEDESVASEGDEAKGEVAPVASSEESPVHEAVEPSAEEQNEVVPKSLEDDVAAVGDAEADVSEAADAAEATDDGSSNDSDADDAPAQSGPTFFTYVTASDEEEVEADSDDAAVADSTEDEASSPEKHTPQFAPLDDESFNTIKVEFGKDRQGEEQGAEPLEPVKSVEPETAASEPEESSPEAPSADAVEAESAAPESTSEEASTPEEAEAGATSDEDSAEAGQVAEVEAKAESETTAAASSEATENEAADSSAEVGGAEGVSGAEVQLEQGENVNDGQPDLTGSAAGLNGSAQDLGSDAEHSLSSHQAHGAPSRGSSGSNLLLVGTQSSGQEPASAAPFNAANSFRAFNTLQGPESGSSTNRPLHIGVASVLSAFRAAAQASEQAPAQASAESSAPAESGDAAESSADTASVDDAEQSPATMSGESAIAEQDTSALSAAQDEATSEVEGEEAVVESVEAASVSEESSEPHAEEVAPEDSSAEPLEATQAQIEAKEASEAEVNAAHEEFASAKAGAEYDGALGAGAAEDAVEPSNEMQDHYRAHLINADTTTFGAGKSGGSGLSSAYSTPLTATFSFHESEDVSSERTMQGVLKQSHGAEKEKLYALDSSSFNRINPYSQHPKLVKPESGAGAADTEKDKGTAAPEGSGDSTN